MKPIILDFIGTVCLFATGYAGMMLVYGFGG